jgi:hypothetical protein
MDLFPLVLGWITRFLERANVLTKICFACTREASTFNLPARLGCYSGKVTCHNVSPSSIASYQYIGNWDIDSVLGGPDLPEMELGEP